IKQDDQNKSNENNTDEEIKSISIFGQDYSSRSRGYVGRSKGHDGGSK
ncbi:15793_t:CDS:2, partial [Funneliformis mosseae]